MSKTLLPLKTRVKHFDGSYHTHGCGTIIGYNGITSNTYLEEKGVEANELAANDNVRYPYVVRWDKNPSFFEKYPNQLEHFPNMQYEDVYEESSLTVVS